MISQRFEIATVVGTVYFCQYFSTMFNGKTIALLLIIASIPKSFQLTINCAYRESPSIAIGRLKWKIVEGPHTPFSPYGCVLTQLRIKSKLLVRNVTGTHLDGRSNDDVRTLKIIGGGIIASSGGSANSSKVLSFCEIIPAGIGSIFPNIEALTVWRSNLKSVSSVDLQQFGNLREIWLFVNELEYLESKLFQYNPNVQVVSFNGNSIKFIGESFFDFLPNLQQAFFHYNRCVDGYATDDTKLISLKNEIKEKCSVNETTESVRVTIDCTFEFSSNWKTVRDPYGCTLHSSNFDRKLFIANATGTHINDHTNDDVTALQIVGGICYVIPGEFGSIFPNIEALAVWNASLQLVTSRDMQQFSNLREIWLHGNDLDYLEEILFEFNPKVEMVVFRDNKIKFVGGTFFDYLPNLLEADFVGNECFDDGGETVPDLQLNAVVDRVKRKCVVAEPTYIFTTIRESKI